jgi:hypothetical protein
MIALLASRYASLDFLVQSLHADVLPSLPFLFLQKSSRDLSNPHFVQTLACTSDCSGYNAFSEGVTVAPFSD